MSRRLLVWRHGRTEWNARGLAQGQADVDLDDTGRAQARQVAPWVARYAPARIVSSDLRRARDTASVLAELTGLTVTCDDRLREFDVGARQGLTTAETFAAFPEQMAAWQRGEEARFGDSETLVEAASRFAAALADVAAATAEHEVSVVVSHGGAMRVGICAWLELPQSVWGRFGGFENCRWAVLHERVSRPGHWRLTDWNAGATPQWDAGVSHEVTPSGPADSAPSADDA